MTVWLVATAVLVAATLPCLAVAMTRPLRDGLVALELATTLVTLALMAFAEGAGRSSYHELAIVLAGLGFAGGLVVVRLLERVE